MPVHYEGQVSLSWVDPGTTTGFVTVLCDKEWLVKGAPSYEALGRAIEIKRLAQVGRHSDDVLKDDLTFAKTTSGTVGVDQSTADELASAHLVIDWLSEDVGQSTPAAWGYESFNLRKFDRDPDLLSPVRMISSILYGMAYTDITHVGHPFSQIPSMRAQCTDDRLKAMNLYVPYRYHAMDALRHAVQFLRKCRNNPGLVASAWPNAQ